MTTPPYHCPVPKCDRRTYPTLEAVKAHLKSAEAEGDLNHIEIKLIEGWDEKPMSMS